MTLASTASPHLVSLAATLLAAGSAWAQTTATETDRPAGHGDLYLGILIIAAIILVVILIAWMFSGADEENPTHGSMI